MWSLKAYDICGAKKDGRAMESRSFLLCASSPLAQYEVDGRKLFPPLWVMCIVA